MRVDKLPSVSDKTITNSKGKLVTSLLLIYINIRKKFAVLLNLVIIKKSETNVW